MNAKEKFKFSEYFKELKSINESFEKEDLDLEEAIKKFERGLFLAQQLKNRLKKVENQIEEIKIKFSDLKKDFNESVPEEN